MEVKSILLKSR